MPSNPIKTLAENFSSRHTLVPAPIHVAYPALWGEAFGRPRRHVSQGEQKTKGEEKANRNTRPLEIR